ncbi:MAG: hypothetical protein ACRD1N_07385 [Terriglobia bacterium]
MKRDEEKPNPALNVAETTAISRRKWLATVGGAALAAGLPGAAEALADKAPRGPAA